MACSHLDREANDCEEEPGDQPGWGRMKHRNNGIASLPHTFQGNLFSCQQESQGHQIGPANAGDQHNDIALNVKNECDASQCNTTNKCDNHSHWSRFKAQAKHYPRPQGYTENEDNQPDSYQVKGIRQCCKE